MLVPDPRVQDRRSRNGKPALRSQCEFKRVVLCKDDLAVLTVLEQRLVAMSLIVKNEIGILLTCNVLSTPLRNGNDDPLNQARSNQMLFFMLLLAGKLNEAWATLKADYLGKPEFETLRLRLPGYARRALTRIEKYFGTGSRPICMMRNNFAFHYEPKVVAASWERLHGSQKFQMWVTSAEGSSRCDLGSVLAFHELNRVFSGRHNGQARTGMQLFLEDTTRVAGWFSSFYLGILMTLLVKDVSPVGEWVVVNPDDDPGLAAFPLPSEIARFLEKRGRDLKPGRADARAASPPPQRKP